MFGQVDGLVGVVGDVVYGLAGEEDVVGDAGDRIYRGTI